MNVSGLDRAGALTVPVAPGRQSVAWDAGRTVTVKEIQGMSGGKMRAWVLTRPGELKLQEVAIPEISENQVLVEIERACICNGSDPGIYHGHEAYQTPMVFGHEASGRIIRKGRKVEQFQVGDRVCWWFEAGAFAEYQAVTVDNVAMFRVPENLSLEEGPVLELVLASCRAIMELPAAEDRKSMVICGLGPSGLVLLQYVEPIHHPEDTMYQWYAEVDDENTTIYANFQGKNPNEELVEVNVRRSCFYPVRIGRNYITVRGFEMAQTACPWTPPTADQPALLGVNWAKGWVIEKNIIHDAKCSAISIGKEESMGHNLCTRTNRKPGYQYQMESVFRAL